LSRPEPCPVCARPGPSPVLTIPRAPVLCNRVWPTREAALDAPVAPISLHFCEGCGHLFNGTFDAWRVEYGPHYNNSLHGSGHFRSFANQLAQALCARYALRGKRVVEIGCGQGDFLRLLCAHGDNTGIGFDPSISSSVNLPEERLTLVAEPYIASATTNLTPDLVCCRHLLEHLDDPVGFLSRVRRACAQPSGTPVYFEVPNALWTLKDGGVWDILYEHCGYFTPPSLHRAFVAAGFTVCSVEPAYQGQFLTIHAIAHPEPAPRRRGAETAWPPAELQTWVDSFAQRFDAALVDWGRRLHDYQRRSAPVAAWGAGSKGITFVNLVPGAEGIGTLVDVNPRKQGGYAPGTGHPIVAPPDLADAPPHTVIVMNPIYVDEIRQHLSSIHLAPEVLAVQPTSPPGA
jgi:SAM-dependent methyltransferase